MKLSHAALATTMALISRAQAQDSSSYWPSHFASAFSTGPVATNSFIRESNTTLILPKTQNPQLGNLALWPGMGTSGGDLIQALAISLAGTDSQCGDIGENWCITASTLQTDQEEGAVVKAVPGTSVTMHYKYNDATAMYDQTVSVAGKVVSKLSTTSGHAQGWGTAVECQGVPCGLVPGHQYVDTTIIMDVADPNYSQTKGTTNATGDMVTKDGGKTWTIAKIVIGDSDFVDASFSG